ncbi:rhodanese-like domain-containing protein [Afipia sp. TerB]
MDGNKLSISFHDLCADLGSGAAQFVVGIRRDAGFAKASQLLGPAANHSPDNIEQWRSDLPGRRQVVTYCVHGDQVSQGVAIALRAMGVDANFLEGGIVAWTERGLPTHRNIGTSPSKWVNFPDDHETLKHGLVIYDALYKWCCLEIEKHRRGSEPHVGESP